jgi:hypothetical protein
MAVAEILIDLVRERIDAVDREIWEGERAEMYRQHLATAFWEDD